MQNIRSLAPILHLRNLPRMIGELRIHNLEVAGSTIDLSLVRHDQDVGVNVLRRQGDVQIAVVK